jgi:recombination protein RecT
MAADLTQALRTTRATPPAAQPPAKRNTVFDLLVAKEADFELALPKHMSVKKFLRVALTTIRTVRGLADCDFPSIMAAMMMSAQLGLEPGGVLGEAYFVPFGKQVTFIPGYRGLMKLARNSGLIANIYAQEVYEGDELIIAYGLLRDLVHIPAFREDNGPKTLTHVYAVAHYKEPGVPPAFIILTRAQVDETRKRSKTNKDTTPWATDYIAMAQKTAIRRLCKWLPQTSEEEGLRLAKAAAMDEVVSEPGMTFDNFDFSNLGSDPIEGNATDVTPPANKETGEIPRDPTAEEIATAAANEERVRAQGNG